MRVEAGDPVAVIGAGFSGTMAALQLLTALPAARPVLLCERADTFGRGLAYGTGDPAHLLNVRASNMSAYPDRPRHFEDWLSGQSEPADGPARVHATPAGTFAARGLYGRYLTGLLKEAVTGDGPPRLRLVNDTVTDLEPVPGGFLLRSAGGRAHRVAGAVLAMGNLAAAAGPASRHRRSPWEADSVRHLRPDRPVLILGTGLTMVDTVAGLRRRGFPGPVTALSRRGLLPNVHAPTAPWPAPGLSSAELGSLPRLVARIRAEVAAAERTGTGWRGVIDALRPVTDAIWRALPEPERARFLRHLRPFWDVHRHRTAPPAADLVAAEIARGSLSVRAGRVVAITDEPDRVLVTWRPRGTDRSEALPAQRILDATGIGPVAGTADPLLRRLIARGLARPGPFGLGLDVDADYRVRGDEASTRLWTLGPLLRGVLWECTAVPDIRNQAAELAASLAGDLARAQLERSPDPPSRRGRADLV